MAILFSARDLDSLEHNCIVYPVAFEPEVNLTCDTVRFGLNDKVYIGESKEDGENSLCQ